MLWGLPSAVDPNFVTALQTPGTKNVLGFNEPDLTWPQSANLKPDAAAAGYKTYLEPFAGQVHIGTPNVLWNNDNSVSKHRSLISQYPIQVPPLSHLHCIQICLLTSRKWTSGGSYNSRVWTQYFLGNCTGCQFNFAAIHYYQDCFPASGQSGSDWFIGNVTNAWNTLQLPIWITEFQCYGTDAQQAQFLQTVLPWLDAQSWVQRYAYFGAFPGYLLNDNGTGLSLTGAAYVS